MPAARAIRYAVSRNVSFRVPGIVNGIVLSTLRDLASSGAVRSYTLTGQAGGYTLAVRYGMAHQVLIAKRGEPRLFAKVETAFDLLRSLGVGSVEVIIAGYEAKPRAYRKGRPAALKALDAIQRGLTGTERWGQKYRCGCFIGFRTKAAIAASCPDHMRDKLGAAMPLIEPTEKAQIPLKMPRRRSSRSVSAS